MTDRKRGPAMEYIPFPHDKAAFAAWAAGVAARASTFRSDAELAAFITQAGGTGAARAQALLVGRLINGVQINQLYENYKDVKWTGDTATGHGSQFVDGVETPFTDDWHGVNTYGNNIVPWLRG